MEKASSSVEVPTPFWYQMILPSARPVHSKLFPDAICLFARSHASVSDCAGNVLIRQLRGRTAALKINKNATPPKNAPNTKTGRGRNHAKTATSARGNRAIKAPMESNLSGSADKLLSDKARSTPANSKIQAGSSRTANETEAMILAHLMMRILVTAGRGCAPLLRACQG